MGDKFYCGFKTTKGGLCKKIVNFKGEKCHLHATKSQIENVKILPKITTKPIEKNDFVIQIQELSEENLMLRRAQKHLSERVSFLEDKLNKLLNDLRVPSEETQGHIGKVPSWETFEEEGQGFEIYHDSEIDQRKEAYSRKKQNEKEWVKEANQTLESMIDNFLPVS